MKETENELSRLLKEDVVLNTKLVCACVQKYATQKTLILNQNKKTIVSRISQVFKF